MDFEPAFMQQTALPPKAFKASMRSTLGSGIWIMILVALGFAIATGVTSGVKSVMYGAATAFFAWIIWFLGKTIWGKDPYIVFGPDGITGKAMRDKPLNWNEVTNLSTVSIQGHPQLHIDLKPQPGMAPTRKFLIFSSNVHKRVIPLTALRKPDSDLVMEAAAEAFIRYSPATAIQAVEAEIEEIRATDEFDARLRELTPYVWAMPMVMGACILVWMANVYSGMSFMAPTAEELFKWGGNSTSAVQSGQWWRLVTAMFLHGGIIHLALNMYALWESGLMVTRLFGNRGFLLVYFGAGIAGSALSLHYSGQTGVSVGASGAVFGVAGALLAAVIQHRGKFPMKRSNQLLTSMTVFIMYSLLYGFSREGIDNAAHIGGLLAGLLAGWLLVEKIDETAEPAKRRSRFVTAGALCLGAATLVAAMAQPAQRNMASFFENGREWQTLQPEIKSTMAAFKKDADDAGKGKLDQATLYARTDTMHVPAMLRVEARLAALKKSDDATIDRFVSAQRRVFGTMALLLQADSKHAKQPSDELAGEIKRLTEELNAAGADLKAVDETIKNKRQTK